MYLLPPSKSAELIRCVLLPSRPATAARPMQLGQGQVQGQGQGQAAQQLKRKAPESAAPHSSGSKVASTKPTSLLASLASRASAGVEARVANQANRLAKQAATSYIDKMETDLHVRLEAFREQVCGVPHWACFVPRRTGDCAFVYVCDLYTVCHVLKTDFPLAHTPRFLIH